MSKSIRIAVLLAALVVIAIIVVGLNINTLVKNGVETVGPMVLGVDVELKESKLSLFSGGGSLKGLKVHNPKGYKTSHLFNMDDVTLQVDVMSLTSDTIHIRKILIDGPHVIYEGDLKNSNLKTLMDGMKGEDSAPTKDPGEEEPKEDSEEKAPAKEKKLIIDHLLIQNVKMGVSSPLLQGKDLSLTLPPIELKDIGKDTGGATPKEVITQVVKQLYTSVEPAIRKGISNLGANFEKIQDQLKEGKVDKEEIKKGVEGLKNLFGK